MVTNRVDKTRNATSGRNLAAIGSVKVAIKVPGELGIRYVESVVVSIR